MARQKVLFMQAAPSRAERETVIVFFVFLPAYLPRGAGHPAGASAGEQGHGETAIGGASAGQAGAWGDGGPRASPARART